MNVKIPRKYVRIAFLLALAFSLTIHFNLIENTFFDDYHDHRGKVFTLGFIVFQFAVTLVVAITMFLWNYRFYKPFYAENKLNFRDIAVSIVSSLLIMVLILLFSFLLRNLFEFEVNPRRDNEEMISRNLYCVVGVLISIFVMRFIHQKQMMQLEVEQLRTQGLQSQLESLKNQMSPHFLFNSLTALKTLVEENPETANDYINHLSQVLRHSLQSHKRELVTLKEELELTRSYVFLLKIRYGKNLMIENSIDANYHDFEIPPLTIQNLVENAVKHNEISKEHPLEIVIETQPEGKLRVKNNIQEKLTPEQGTGIGLTNLIKLYRLIGKSEVQIFQERNTFVVEVPLIKPDSYESIDN
jgi:sensor histidine kinase YesM